MIDFVQSNLVALVAASLIAAALLGVAASEGEQREKLELQRAIDAVAFAIASADCSPAHPETRIPIAAVLGHVKGLAISIVLLPDHLRAVRQDAGALTSLEFPPLRLDGPVEISRARALDLIFDSVEERCAASPVNGA
jgi:hypothetical protein